MDVVFNNQKHSVSRLNLVAIILKHLNGIFQGSHDRGWKFETRPMVEKARRANNLCRGADVGLRQI